MSTSPLDRREFLARASAAGAWAIGVQEPAASKPASAPAQDEDAPQSEPAVPPGIDVATIAAGERLARLEYAPQEREMIVKSIGEFIGVYSTLREERLENGEGPAERFQPRLPGAARAERAPSKKRAPESPKPPFPTSDDDLAFAPVSALADWVRTKQVSSERLTRLSLDRLKRYGPGLECVITLTESLALEQARRADREIALGKHRGPLHGIPYGLKDLFDTKGVATTWGAEPWKDRVPASDATVVRKLEEAGAVCVAKLSLGALAYGDIWFGGTTKNPFDPKQGSSGSSAGSACASAAGLVAFALGTETWGSIASPAARCGAAGYRPTFGRVSRAGAMALCWSLDKVGPLARTVEDCALVLQAIAGFDAADPDTVERALPIDLGAACDDLAVGFVKSEFEGRRATPGDAATLDALRKLGVKLVPVEVPPGPYEEVINLLICVEAAAAFDDMTRTKQDARLKWQAPNAWPNLLRTTRLVPAVEHVQASRMRRRFQLMAARLFADVDAIVAPSAHGALHAVTNMTGHPAVTLRQSFRDATPRGVTLWGRIDDDGTLLRLGSALERELGAWERRPKLG